MKVEFRVYGETEEHMVEMAHKTLGRFSSSKRWNIEISAEPDIISGDGVVTMWRGDVSASHETPEAG